MANKVGLSPEHLSRLETGDKKARKIGLEYLINISKELDVSMQELFMKDSNLLSLRFVISEHNIETLKEVVKMIKDLIESK